MKGDFTRSTFDPKKHYRGVRQQQGRVQVDADWNENLDILLHRIETETVDVIGACGVPVHDAGFGVVTDFDALTPEEKKWLKKLGVENLGNGEFLLTQGRAYVDGILVENDHTVLFTRQPFIPPPALGPLNERVLFSPGLRALAKPGIYQLYLDVWERHLTFLEDPAIREVALGGPDTATRTQAVWQAVVTEINLPHKLPSCADKLTPWPGPSTGRLSARTHPAEVPDSPCPVPPGAGYTRLENQLYRVEMHHGSEAGPSFKWSRDNGSVVVTVEEFAVDGSPDKIRTASLGRDDYLGLHEQDWVEMLDDAVELAGKPGDLVQILKIDPDNILTLSQPVTGLDIKRHAKVRRWDSPGAIPVSIPADNDGYLKLEGGVEIKFESATANFRTGDYWLIPARTVPGQFGDIEWPQDAGQPVVLPPAGITHHYCRLAVLTVSDLHGQLHIEVEDCRKKFPPLTELPTGGDCCCSVTVGEGGDYSDLQEAIEARPQGAAWWTVCVRPGRLTLNKTVTVAEEKAQGLIIQGCGDQCYIFNAQGDLTLAFSGGRGIKLQGLSIGGEVRFSQSDSLRVNDCTLNNLIVDNCRGIEIRNNDLEVRRDPAIQVNGLVIDILNNRMIGGGIQVIPPSSWVNIEDNVIERSAGAGIQLGGGDKTVLDYVNMFASAQSIFPATVPTHENLAITRPGLQPAAAIQQVKIHRNLIRGMRGSGIITETTLSEGASLGDVEFLSIRENQIVGCGKLPDVNLGHGTSVGGGIVIMGIFNAQIKDNFIAYNGNDNTEACGVFVLDGSAIDISDNVVAENGRSKDSDQSTQYQAGIAVHFVFGNLFGSLDGPLRGYPALRLCDNDVFCPAGQALTVMAIGDVLATGNILVSRGRLKQPGSPLNFGVKAACVFLGDGGLPVWIPRSALPSLLTSGLASLHFDNVTQGISPAYPEGRVIFHHNQVTFSSDVEETVEKLGDQWPQKFWEHCYLSALFISLDDISLSGNQFQALVPKYILIGEKQVEQGVDEMSFGLKFIDAAALGVVVRTNANGFSELLWSNFLSFLSYAMMNVTTSNEATHWIWSSAANPQKNSYANNLALFS
jgi:hypothetical protein